MTTHEIVNCPCPLCSDHAGYYEIDYGERHYYKCPTCTKFIITDTAESCIRKVGVARPDFSSKAASTTKNDSESVLEISYSHWGREASGFLFEVVKKSSYRI